MSSEKAEAIVIRQVDFSESSRVVTFFSREFGKFAALAKGAKRLKGPFDAALDLISRCRIVFLKKSAGSLNLLTEARLISRFRPAKAELTRIYGGYYVAELLAGLTEDFDPAPALYDLTVETLEALALPDSHPPSILVCFEVSFLREIGLLPNLFECSVCGIPVAESTGESQEKSSQNKFAYWVSQGGLLCAECRREEYSGTSVSAGTVQILKQLTQSDAAINGRIVLSQHQARECHRFAVSAISSAMGRKPTTLRYLQF